MKKEVTAMMTKEDWLMHSRATPHLARRIMRYGDTNSAARLMASASRLELFAGVNDSSKNVNRKV
jgi:hypothetical protein